MTVLGAFLFAWKIMSNPLLLLRLASIVLVPNSAQSRVKKSKDFGAFLLGEIWRYKIAPLKKSHGWKFSSEANKC